MVDKSPDDPPPSAWASLGPVDQAREWEDFRPGTFEQVFEFVKHEADYRRHEADYRRDAQERAARHERFLDYVAIAIQILTVLCALTAVVLLVLTARYYADHGAASQGVKIFGFGAASIVAAFLGIRATPIVGRLRSRSLQSRRKNNNSEQSAK